MGGWPQIVEREEEERRLYSKVQNMIYPHTHISTYVLYIICVKGASKSKIVLFIMCLPGHL